MLVYIVFDEVDYEDVVVAVFSELEAALAFISESDHGGYFLYSEEGHAVR